MRTHSPLDPERFRGLDALLADHGWLWRPSPFKEQRPPWCDRLPDIARTLLTLSDADVQTLSARPDRVASLLAAEIPDLARIPGLCTLPHAGAAPLPRPSTRLDWAIPGRKWEQIQAFAAAIGTVRGPLLEWCGGKGHLGRLLAQHTGTEVLTLEIDPQLCSAGEALARRLGAAQSFVIADAVSPASAAYLPGRHAVALHACGALHRSLVREAISERAPALDIVPCCYHLGSPERYQPLGGDSRLAPTRDDLRLAVTAAATATPRELRLRDREMAWKLGYDLLRRESSGEDRYRPIRPIRKPWLALDFEGFCRRLAERDGLNLPGTPNWRAWEQAGWGRQRETMRLSLVRQAFRRPLEIWLVSDMGRHLQGRGYSVELQTFCSPDLSPRNILLSARL